MKISLRSKMNAIAVITGIGFVLVIGTVTLVSGIVNSQLMEVREKHIPLIESGPKLRSTFEQIKRELQDSVGSKDLDALNETRDLHQSLLDGLKDLEATASPEELRVASADIFDWYQSARKVSERLMSGEMGIGITAAIKKMQAKQLKAENSFSKAITFDRSHLESAFLEITEARKVAQINIILISVSVVLLVLFSVFWLGRGLVQSVDALVKGLAKFGKGDFTEPVTVTNEVELQQVADQANHMAAQIQVLLKELEAFSYSVAHDLRAPLRGVQGFSTALLEENATTLSPESKRLIDRIISAGKRMGLLIDGLLSLSQITRKEMTKTDLDLSAMAAEVLSNLAESTPGRKVDIVLPEDRAQIQGDSRLMQVVLTNLLGNAWKFTSKNPEARIEFGKQVDGGQPVYYVRDNGAGFDMKYVDKLFGTFQRLHGTEEFEGTGIGLATVQRILIRHGGKIWANSIPGQGTTFFFTMGQ